MPSSRVQDEIGQSRPFRSREQECLVGLLRTSDVVRQRLAKVIEPSGITLQQYNVLRILRGAGARGLPTLVIAGRMIERSPGITRLLGRLERKGLVRRSRSASDQRCVVCRVTRSGLALLEQMDARIDAADRECLSALAGEQVERLIGLLDAVRAAPREQPATATDPDLLSPD